MTELIVAFRDFASAPKMKVYLYYRKGATKSVEKGRKFVVVGSHFSVNVSAIIFIEVNGYKINASIRACDPSSEKFLV